MLWITPATGDAFGPVETALQDTFIMAFFYGVGEGIPDRGVAHLPVKQLGLALPDPTNTAPKNWTASCFIN